MNNNQKATKRALLTSVMALVMCVVMLVGTTFAWFTDTASTAVNKIQAGNLDVKLLAEDGETSLEGATLEWQKAAGAEDGDILWEPGCRYKLQPIIIKNAGNLALMLMYGKEASNRKQEIDRQHYTIPNQRPKDKHCGKI